MRMEITPALMKFISLPQQQQQLFVLIKASLVNGIGIDD
jgi:hypothetical protein